MEWEVDENAEVTTVLKYNKVYFSYNKLDYIAIVEIMFDNESNMVDFSIKDIFEETIWTNKHEASDFPIDLTDKIIEVAQIS